jgi:hypothetical protein
VATASLPDGTNGQAYAATLQAAGGTGVGNTWRIVSGALPPGLSLAGDRACVAWDGFVQVGTIEPDEGTGERTEISGLAASRRNPGILWAHDDSGGAAILHAIAEDGTVRRRYVLDQAPFDWEDIALGPGPDPALEYLYVGDVGDNSKARPHVTILRVEEPIVTGTGGDPIPLAHEAFPLRYPDGARDCEALLVDWETGTPYLLAKDDAGGDAFRAPMPLDPAWTETDPGTLVAATSGGPLPSSVTAADAARDGRRIVLRSYTLGYEMVAGPGEAFEAVFAADPCLFSVPLLGQYESLALAGDGTALYTTTELVLGDVVPLHRAMAAADNAGTTIAGTSTTAGSWEIVVEVRDTSGAAAMRTLTITVR